MAVHVPLAQVVSTALPVHLVPTQSLDVPPAPKMEPHATHVESETISTTTHVIHAQRPSPTAKNVLMRPPAPNAEPASTVLFAQLVVPLSLNVQLVHKMGRPAPLVMRVSLEAPVPLVAPSSVTVPLAPLMVQPVVPVQVDSGFPETHVRLAPRVSPIAPLALRMVPLVTPVLLGSTLMREIVQRVRLRIVLIARVQRCVPCVMLGSSLMELVARLALLFPTVSPVLMAVHVQVVQLDSSSMGEPVQLVALQ